MASRLIIAAILLLAFPRPAAAAEHSFARSALVGVWEVVACEGLFPRQASSPATTPNSKYCFGPREAYPELPADAADDSADGSGDYYVVGGDILVIRTGVPGGLHAFQLESVGPKQIVWQQGNLRVTLRRIARIWDGRHAPKLRPQNIRISYPLY